MIDNSEDGNVTRTASVASVDAVTATTWLLLVVLCTVQFVDVLGTTFLIVALPSLQDEMGLSNASTELLAGLFALFFGALLILGGKLADIFGARSMLIAGLWLFIVASCVGGMAPNPFLLFAGRSGQGISAALAVPAALSLLIDLFPSGPDRNRALGVWTAAGAVGGVSGLAVGGLVTDLLGWRWVFLINVPIVLIALLAVFRLAPRVDSQSQHRSLDIRGAVLVTGGLLALILGLSNLRTSPDATNLAILFAGIVLLAAFVVVERSATDPLVPFRLVKLPSVTGASMVAFALTFTTSAAGVILSLYLQGALGIAPTRAGLLLAPFSVAVVVGSVIGSRLTSMRGFRAPMVAGLLAIMSGMLTQALGMGLGSLPWIVAGLVMSGGGIGCASVATTGCGLSNIDEGDKGAASGLITSAAMLGTAIGIATLGVIAALRTSSLAEGNAPSNAALTSGYQVALIAAAIFAAALVPVAVLSAAKTRKDGY